MVTLDTNVAFYAFSEDAKAKIARDILVGADFISVQVLNEFASASYRKRGRSWSDVELDLATIRRHVPAISPLTSEALPEAVRLAKRYRILFYDALMLAVALAGGARTIYSEDMQHGLVIDDTLRIIDPFR